MEIYPTNFLDSYQVGDHSIKYTDIVEMAQAAPEIGSLVINGVALAKDEYFGGPPVFYKGKMFVPHLKRTLFGGPFRLCVIDLNLRTIRDLGGPEQLVLISKVDDDTVSFYRDIPNKTLKTIRWKV